MSKFYANDCHTIVTQVPPFNLKQIYIIFKMKNLRREQVYCFRVPDVEKKPGHDRDWIPLAY